MLLKTKTIESKFDETLIPVKIKSPDGREPTTWFILIHGLTTSKSEYLDFYEMVSDGLIHKGIGCLSFDCRAHGESQKSGNEFNLINCIKDTLSCVRWLQENYGNCEINLFGTSFGASIAICTAQIIQEMIKSVFLLAPVLDFTTLYLDPPEGDRRDKYDNFIKRTLFQDEVIDLDGRVFLDYQNAIEFSLINLGEIISKLRIPLSVMHGTHDTMVPYKTTQRVINGCPNAKLFTFEKMDHGFTDIDDETGASQRSQENLTRILEVLSSDK